MVVFLSEQSALEAFVALVAPEALVRQRKFGATKYSRSLS
jgi:hypothetical protein